MGRNRLTHEREAEIVKVIEASIPALRSFARGLSSQDMVADDIVQSACERALRRMDQVTDIAGMKSWLNRIVYTQWQDTLRKRQSRKTKLIQFGEYQSACSENREAQVKHITRLDLRRALDQLSPEHRVAVVLVSMLGYGYQEASDILEIPVGTVASRVARARSLLAEFLRPGNAKIQKNHLYGRVLNENCR